MDSAVRVALPIKQRRAIERAATKEGITLSMWIRQALRAQLREVTDE
jgi:LDH2 family malate/lactate/ureidoglycolate dehydrogenase